jgi:hypothetical protein
MGRLPAASHYVEAQKNDPEYARHVVRLLDAEDGPAKWAPRVAEWTTQHELMAAFFDRLGDWLVQYANSNKPKGAPSVKPLPRFPRPVTAVERERAAIERRAEAELDDLIDRAHAHYQRENGG